MALRMARNIREGHKVGWCSWLIAKRLKIKGMGIQLPSLANGGEGLGMKGWREYASVLDKKAKGLRSRLHCCCLPSVRQGTCVTQRVSSKKLRCMSDLVVNVCNQS